MNLDRGLTLFRQEERAFRHAAHDAALYARPCYLDELAHVDPSFLVRVAQAWGYAPLPTNCVV